MMSSGLAGRGGPTSQAQWCGSFSVPPGTAREQYRKIGCGGFRGITRYRDIYRLGRLCLNFEARGPASARSLRRGSFKFASSATDHGLAAIYKSCHAALVDSPDSWRVQYYCSFRAAQGPACQWRPFKFHWPGHENPSPMYMHVQAVFDSISGPHTRSEDEG